MCVCVCVCVDRVVDAQTQIWRPVDNAGHESEEGPDEGARRKGCGFTHTQKKRSGDLFLIQD